MSPETGSAQRPEYDGTTLPPKRKLPEARPFLADSRRLANAMARTALSWIGGRSLRTQLKYPRIVCGIAGQSVRPCFPDSIVHD